jgi:predicted RNase H-like HicB family nuclease
MKSIELKGKPGTWVALSDDLHRVVAKGNSLREAAKNAEKQGEKHPTFAQVPSPNCTFVL